KYLNTEAELRDMLVSLVGGRAAEEIVFETVTTGAANDIEKATDIARNMVTRYGMSKKFGLMGLATIESQYLEGRTALNCSDSTAAEIDAEVVEILKESYEKALALLRENRELMDKLAAFLIEKETITGKEFMQIFRKEKGLPDPKEDEQDGNKAGAEKGGKAGAADGEKETDSGNRFPKPIEMPDPISFPEPEKAETFVEQTMENETSAERTAGMAGDSEVSAEQAESTANVPGSSQEQADQGTRFFQTEQSVGPDQAADSTRSVQPSESSQPSEGSVGRFSNHRLDE
ncbi:MAG: ATP-dependent metallopeptidase HflB, partial [Lachnospiraceae bacterium]|nr:ATP-dependent metallopeptidase HflB [Lachnospiraceae bacterium]